MLKIEDIQPGHLLSYMDGESYIIVAKVHGTTVEVIESIRPIPNRTAQFGNLAGVEVTKENLLRLGFKEPNIYRSMRLLPLTLSEENGLWYHRTGDTLDTLTPILFIHELQNLYKEKSGKDLNISPFFDL